ncbi:MULTISPECIES: hypothetical protein [Lysinibacillus]|uniref:hypothetical protein n=1 Tax=Lysinibacillus TaxID=400634 RepID=UPI001319D4DF|nr:MULTISPECIES: hypothetical protein [Lysinibacillus]
MKKRLKVAIIFMTLTSISAGCTDNGDETPVEVKGNSEMKGPKGMEASIDVLLHEV